MENKRGSEIFLGVIGVATLVVAIIGATFAFFSASNSSAENAVYVNSTTLGLGYVDNVGTNLKTALIPAAENIATYAALEQTGTGSEAHNQCIDDNGNEVCGVYQFTISNPSETTSQDVSVILKISSNNFKNLKYKVYEGTAADLTSSSTAKVAATTFSTETNNETTLLLGTANAIPGDTTGAKVHLGTTSSDNSKTYTMVIWVNEAGADNVTNDAGKSFAAGLTVTTGSGTGVTGVISAAG